MIYSGDSSIADAKFGSQQLAKIYRGSDLVWENDEWVEFVFPSPGLLMTSLHKPLGFTITDDTANNNVPNAYKFFANAKGVYSGLTQRTRYQWTRVNFVLPSELGTVRLKSFKAWRCNLLNEYQVRPGSINLLYSSDAVSASVTHTTTGTESDTDPESLTNGFASIAHAGYGNISIDSFYNNTERILASEPEVKTIRFCIAAPYWGSSSTKTVAGEKYNFTFKVKKSCLEAWKAAYDLPIENESQEDIN